MRREAIEGIIEALEAGEQPTLELADFPTFSEEATAGNDHLSPADLTRIAEGLAQADIPTFQRALKAMDEGDLAWLGFKLVYDGAAAMSNTDNEVTKKYGDEGSANADSFVFFCNDAKEIVSAHGYSARDTFQMKDVTRGPSMHNQQFEGLTWTSVPLFGAIRVWLLGASDVAVELARLASHVGFEVKVADYDPAYLNEERFPSVERVMLHGGDFHELANLSASPEDYVCVLTRGHMFDPESCIWALENDVRYVGMMGCAGKNSTVHDLVINAGITEEDWERVKRPIGLKFGAKTPAELAIAIVAELIDVRYKERYSKEAQDKHEASLGR
ncbi:MAG: XdhC/CoxF family protein [Eggerthellaceae bacterium]|nr:XdhC/CoxF family protein [Eggerthellaceae bacterium]